MGNAIKRSFLENAGRGVDALIGVFSPQTAYKREAFRRANAVTNRASHKAADRGRGRESWYGDKKSADAALLPEHALIRERARDLVRNHPVASGVIETTVVNEIRTGIYPLPRIDYELVGQSAEWARKQHSIIRRHFEAWTRHVEVGGRLTWAGMQELARRQMFIDGEVFLFRRIKRRFRSPYSLSFEIVEGDRVGDPIGKPLDAAGNAIDTKGRDIRGGIEQNADGMPLAYWVSRSHPGDTFSRSRISRSQEFVRVPAFDRFGNPNVIHGYKMKRPGQSRGVSAFDSVMDFFQNLDEYMEAELMAARIAACFSLFIRKEGELATMAAANATETLSDGKRIEELFPGMIEYLRDGETIESFMPQRPGDPFETFIATCINFIAMGMNLSPQAITQNWKDMNYSGMRGTQLNDRRVFRASQGFQTEIIYQPIYEMLVEELHLKEMISLPQFDEFQLAYTDTQWIYPGFDWVDPLKESKADIEAINARLLTYTESLSKRGVNLNDHFQLVAEEADLIKDLGIDIPDPNAKVKPVEPQKDAPDEIEDLLAELGNGRH